MGLFGGSEEKRDFRDLISNVVTEIAEADASIAANLEEANYARERACIRRAQKWEYLAVDDVDEATLDKYGRNGWELVSVASYTVGFGLGGNSSMKVHVRYVFKRMFFPEYPEEACEFLDNINRWKEVKLELRDKLTSLQADYDAL